MRISISEATPDELLGLLRMVHISKFAPDEQPFFLGSRVFNDVAIAAAKKLLELDSGYEYDVSFSCDMLTDYMTQIMVEQALRQFSNQFIVSDEQLKKAFCSYAVPTVLSEKQIAIRLTFP
ncbi:hypothetical protein [Shimia sp. Alg240-R146]|uniref:hypothetical protein n=1 Tax=Shimia sp. Alg240-R146 TaxID=2993449 RepID=UPI0022E90FD6|nr:hypothetical protein [Shimia sp. Alg240-R146]